MPKLIIDKNLAAMMHPHAHGTHKKIGAVLHETVSSNWPGLKDINSVAEYLAYGEDGYAIHGITDDDAKIGWAKGYGEDVYWHCAGGHANSNFLGIEQVSRVMLDWKSRKTRIKAWLHMNKELNATGKLLACCARAHDFELLDNHGDTTKQGVTTHYEVTIFNHVEGGHTDAWPVNAGGYYPKVMVLKLARRYYKLGWHF